MVFKSRWILKSPRKLKKDTKTRVSPQANELRGSGKGVLAFSTSGSPGNTKSHTHSSAIPVAVYSSICFGSL